MLTLTSYYSAYIAASSTANASVEVVIVVIVVLTLLLYLRPLRCLPTLQRSLPIGGYHVL